MAALLFAVLLGFGLGMSLAAPPGPVNALIARSATQGGARAGIRAGFPAPVVDTGIMLLVLFGVTRLIDLERWTPWLATIGFVLMTWLAWQVARVHDSPTKALSGPGAVWLVTLTNPYQYAWWISAGAADLLQLGVPGILGFLAAIYSWVFIISALVAHGAMRWPWFTSAITIVSSNLLLVYALRLLWRGALAGT